MKAAALILLLAVTGCVKTVIRSPDGWQFERVAVGNKTSVGEITIPVGTNTARIRGYANDQTELAEAIAHGIAAGLKP